MPSKDRSATKQTQLPTGIDVEDKDQEESELEPFTKQETYLFEQEDLVNAIITIALLVGAQIGWFSIWWLFGFFALTVIPIEANKVRTHGIRTYLGVINFRTPSLKDIGIMVVGLVAIFATVVVVSVGFSPIGSTANQSGHLISDASFNVWIWGGAVLLMYLIVGPLEEYLFRHKMQNFFKDHYNLSTSILFTNGIFSLLHLPVLISSGNPLSYVLPLVILLLIGSIFSVQYEFTDNLAVPSVTHATYNSILLTALFALQSGLV